MSDPIALVRSLAADAAARHEPPPFSDQTIVDVAAGRAVVIGADGAVGVAGTVGAAVGGAGGRAVGAAVVRGAELEIAVAGEGRGRGIGTALLRQALAVEPSPSLAWAHGDGAAARAMAASIGWVPVRTLLQLRRGVGEGDGGAAPSVPDGLVLRPFRVGVDEDAWLALNAAAFAHHPEQGSMTLEDLRAREADSWFVAEDLLLLWSREDASLVGSCWLKVDVAGQAGVGEFYAVAVRPDQQGRGIGGVLMAAGMHRLSGRGLDAAALYVEGDNAPALALYRRAGFEQYAVDVQYAARG